VAPPFSCVFFFFFYGYGYLFTVESRVPIWASLANQVGSTGLGAHPPNAPETVAPIEHHKNGTTCAACLHSAARRPAHRFALAVLHRREFGGHPRYSPSFSLQERKAPLLSDAAALQPPNQAPWLGSRPQTRHGHGDVKEERSEAGSLVLSTEALGPCDELCNHLDPVHRRWRPKGRGAPVETKSNDDSLLAADAHSNQDQLVETFAVVPSRAVSEVAHRRPSTPSTDLGIEFIV